MKIITKKNEMHKKNIYLEEENKTLSIIFEGNGDLYWNIRNKSYNQKGTYSYDYFDITKENYSLYLLFEQLLSDIKNINIFDEKENTNVSSAESNKEKKNYIKLIQCTSNYAELFDVTSNTITWYSDENDYEVTNILKITKQDDIFKIDFFSKSYIDGYKKKCNTSGTMGIRISNSGSRYAPFNIVFMRMFTKLQDIDDINDYGHQIHIEEYLYNQKVKYNLSIQNEKKLIKK